MKKNAYADTTIKAVGKRLRKLGHKDLRQTLMYSQLVEAMQNDEYHCKTATNIKEATNLIEDGFQYVTDIDGTKLFRKPK